MPHLEAQNPVTRSKPNIAKKSPYHHTCLNFNVGYLERLFSFKDHRFVPLCCQKIFPFFLLGETAVRRVHLYKLDLLIPTPPLTSKTKHILEWYNHYPNNRSPNLPGWWFQPLWKILVSWDDYSQYMENKINVPNHQSVTMCSCSNCSMKFLKSRHQQLVDAGPRQRTPENRACLTDMPRYACLDPSYPLVNIQKTMENHHV